MYPTLAIVTVTYNRAAVLHETLRRLVQYVRYPGSVRYIVADDGSDDGTQVMLKNKYPSFQVVQSSRVGLGANTNAGLLAAFEHTPFVLQLQDDMQLQKPLELLPHIERLASDESSGFIRLWGVAGHKYRADLDEGYWRVLWESPEHYIASDRPHLKHQRFHDAVGFYPEGLTTGNTEEAWCHQVRAAALAGPVPSVLVPLMDTESGWEHVCYGQRWRDKGL